MPGIRHAASELPGGRAARSWTASPRRERRPLNWDALYRSFEAELFVSLRTETGDVLSAHSEADADREEPSGLAGWSRRHVVGHVHFSAEALRCGRLGRGRD